LEAAVAVVAEGDLGTADVEVGVGLRGELRNVVGVVRAGADLEGCADRGLAERRVGVEAEAGAGGVVVDDEDVGRDAVVDDVEGRVDLTGEGQRAAGAVLPGEALGHHLRLGAVVVIARRRRGDGGDGCRRWRDRGRQAHGRPLHGVELGAEGVDLRLLRLDDGDELVDVGRGRLLRAGRRGCETEGQDPRGGAEKPELAHV